MKWTHLQALKLFVSLVYTDAAYLRKVNTKYTNDETYCMFYYTSEVKQCINLLIMIAY